MPRIVPDPTQPHGEFQSCRTNAFGQSLIALAIVAYILRCLITGGAVPVFAWVALLAVGVLAAFELYGVPRLQIGAAGVRLNWFGLRERAERWEDVIALGVKIFPRRGRQYLIFTCSLRGGRRALGFQAELDDMDAFIDLLNVYVEHHRIVVRAYDKEVGRMVHVARIPPYTEMMPCDPTARWIR